MRTATAPATPAPMPPRGRLQYPQKPKRPFPRWRERRVWKVIADPSGDFIGGFFRTMDIAYKPELAHWEIGTKFQNTKTGVTKTWNGTGFDVYDPRKVKEVGSI